MSAEMSLREGHLTAALTELEADVRKEPGNALYRVFLFQLLSVMGEWGRALNQLSVAGELDAATLSMVSTYHEAIRCEALRREVFSGRHAPLLFGKPAQWMVLLIEALRIDAAGKQGQAQKLRAQAFEQAPAVSGTIDQQPFAWIGDADPRLGPMLEVIMNGRYYWVPFNHLCSVQIEAPADLRDLVWMPAHFTFVNGGESVGLIPTRYPESEFSENARIRMARCTEWVESAPDFLVGMGQRMLITDASEYPLMETRLIQLENPLEGMGDASQESACQS